MTGYGAKTSKSKKFLRPKRRVATKQASNEWQCCVQKYQRRGFVHFVFGCKGGKKALMHFRKLWCFSGVHFRVLFWKMLRVLGFDELKARDSESYCGIYRKWKLYLHSSKKSYSKSGKVVLHSSDSIFQLIHVGLCLEEHFKMRRLSCKPYICSNEASSSSIWLLARKE